MTTVYNTGRDTWTHGALLSGSTWRQYLGPCPECGQRTHNYGGGWACVGISCPGLDANHPAWWNTDVAVRLDGSAWMASGAGFVDVQESPCGFGSCPREAVEQLYASRG